MNPREIANAFVSPLLVAEIGKKLVSTDQQALVSSLANAIQEEAELYFSDRPDQLDCAENFYKIFHKTIQQSPTLVTEWISLTLEKGEVAFPPQRIGSCPLLGDSSYTEIIAAVQRRINNKRAEIVRNTFRPAA